MLFGSSLPTRRLWGLCRRGWARTLPIAEERRTGRHGANGWVFTARPYGSDHGVRLYGRPVRECVPAGNGFCPPPPGPVPLRGDSAESGGYSSTLMRTQVRCVCLLINHLQNAFDNVAESGFLFFQIPPHYSSRKNSVVNTPESKVPAKDLRSRVCNRHPRRPTLGVLLTPKAKKSADRLL